MEGHDFVEQDQLQPQVEMLLRENATLKNWVVGILQDCDGCRQEAAQWANAMAATHETAVANGEVVGEVKGEPG